MMVAKDFEPEGSGNVQSPVVAHKIILDGKGLILLRDRILPFWIVATSVLQLPEVIFDTKDKGSREGVGGNGVGDLQDGDGKRDLVRRKTLKVFQSQKGLRLFYHFVVSGIEFVIGSARGSVGGIVFAGDVLEPKVEIREEQ